MYLYSLHAHGPLARSVAESQPTSNVCTALPAPPAQHRSVRPSANAWSHVQGLVTDSDHDESSEPELVTDSDDDESSDSEDAQSSGTSIDSEEILVVIGVHAAATHVAEPSDNAYAPSIGHARYVVYACLIMR